MIFAQPDESLRDCAERPVRRPLTSNKVVSSVLTEAFEYGDDCKSKHDATWESIDRTRKQVDDFNKAQEKIDEKPL